MATTDDMTGTSTVVDAASRQQSLLIVTDRSPWGQLASRYALLSGFAVTHMVWHHGDPVLPRGLAGWTGDWIIGFKADYILDDDELSLARQGALNFHPGPPNCRGVGTYEYAFEERWTTYGVTCHYMSRRVDAGPIVQAVSFPVAAGCAVTTLRELAAAHLYLLFMDVLSRIGRDEKLPESTTGWSGPLHTWREFEERLTRLGHSIID